MGEGRGEFPFSLSLVGEGWGEFPFSLSLRERVGVRGEAMAPRNAYPALVLLVFAFVLACCCIAADGPQPAPKTEVLFEVGGRVHDAVQLPAMLKKVLEDTGQFTVTITQDQDQLKSENIGKYDVVMFYTTRVDPNPDQAKGLLQFVESGGGMVAIHSSTTMGLKSDELWKMMGGKFIKHGSGTFRVKITGKSHPIVRGMSGFEVTDETYVNAFCPDSRLITLMRRETDGEPVSWIQYYGKGRVFCTGLGHDGKVWNHPSFQQMIERALLWADKKLNP